MPDYENDFTLISNMDDNLVNMIIGKPIDIPESIDKQYDTEPLTQSNVANDKIYVLSTVYDILLDGNRYEHLFFTKFAKYLISIFNIRTEEDKIIKSISSFYNNKLSGQANSVNSISLGSFYSLIHSYYGFMCGALNKEWNPKHIRDIESMFIEYVNGNHSQYVDLFELSNLNVKLNKDISLGIWFDHRTGILPNNKITLFQDMASQIFYANESLDDVLLKIKSKQTQFKTIYLLVTPNFKINKLFIADSLMYSNVKIIYINRGRKYSIAAKDADDQCMDLTQFVELISK